MKRLTATLLFAALAVGVMAQEATLKLTLPKDATAGTTVAGTVTITFPDGWHGYQNPPSDKFQTAITVSSPDKKVVLKKVSYPKGTLEDIGGGEKAAVYTGTIKIPVSIVLSGSGKQTIKLKVLSQICNQSTCMPPKFTVLSGSINVKPGKKGK